VDLSSSQTVNVYRRWFLLQAAAVFRGLVWIHQIAAAPAMRALSQDGAHLMEHDGTIKTYG